MESTGQTPPPSSQLVQAASVGELIVQKGGRKGMRKPLNVPLTFIGRDKACDICLNVDGIAPQHCVLVHGPNGLIIRDLDSNKGTLVNGHPIASSRINDGDTLTVGPYEFLIKLPEQPHSESFPGENDALRLQAAAVAAQQVALCEEEVKLQQRLGALEQQKEQLSSHLEDKRRRLVQLNQKAHAERSALHKDRVSYEKYIEKITTDLSQAQREVIDSQQQLQTERRNLGDFHKKLKERWHREFDEERVRLEKSQEELANEACNLENDQQELQQRAKLVYREQLRTNSDYELKRQRLREAWIRIREAQQKWRLRRSQERTALRVRELDVERSEIEAHTVRQHLQQEIDGWQIRRSALEEEVDSLQSRVKNQRLKLFDQQQEIDRLNKQLASLQKQDDGTTGAVSGELRVIEPGRDDASLEQRQLELENTARELADQKLHLAEQWQRLLLAQQRFRQEQLRMLDDAQVVVGQITAQEDEVAQRERAGQDAERDLRQKHEEMLQLRQHLVAWRARLRVHETSWEGKRTQLLADVRAREEMAENNLHALVDVRQRWTKRRRKELEQLRADRAACDKLRREHAELLKDFENRSIAIEEEKRTLAEKALAFEQYRQEFLSRGGDSPAAERRIERLRRRWLTQNANIVRTILRERDSLQVEFARLDEKHAELQKRTDELGAAEAVFVEKQTAWEHKQILAASRQARMQQEVQKAMNQQAATEAQLGKMQDEVERIAKTLLNEPEAPAILGIAA